jgi:uncharacterized protein YfkK (UPF0435 family)
MDVTKKIRIMLATEGLNDCNLAKLLNTSQQNLSAKLKRNNFSIKEMLEIADALGYDLHIEFKKKR